jgi:predicted transcriptional regulator of viral defense system
MDMKKGKSKIDRFREIVGCVGLLHARDLFSMGIPRRYLGRLCADGSLVRTGRGMYMTPGVPETLHLGLAQVTKAVPQSVVCLLSALCFHEIGTQNPHQIWIALSRQTARPHVTNPNIKVVRFSGQSLTEGIEEHDIAGVTVRVYSSSKTVADCFKYRNKIGIDVAIEALREAVRARKCTADELWRYAKICRVSKVMRPYMEVML